MSPTALEFRLIPHRSTWTIIRLSWLPMLSGIAGLAVATAVSELGPKAAELAGMLPLLGFGLGGLASYLIWGRGPALSVVDGMLTLADQHAALDQLEARVDEYVFNSQARYAAGRYWLPQLVLKLPQGERRIVRRGGGGGAGTRKPSSRPQYELEEAEWDALARALGLESRA